MKYLNSEMLIIFFLLSTSVFTFVNVFTNWVHDSYAILSMVVALLADAIWRRYHDNKT